ncbi:Enoyl-[acyl-carrier-protein] reductase [NADPH] FabL (ENR) (Enoyl-acyl carrier protein reductase III) (NADPH-dependent enoyl-ACP reductase), partial [Durusdinium trenchii]
EAASSNAIENWSDRAGRGLLSPYFFIQAWGRHLAENQLVNQATLVGVASLGGDFGTNLATVPAVETGGLCGLLKGIHREVPDMTVKAIDVPAAESATSVVEACLAELSLGRPEVEVSYRRKVRYTPTLLTAPSSQCQPGRPPEQGGVWVVTGGARGVTAVVARELARKYGLRLHLVGSSTLPEIDPKWKNASPQELAAFKKEVSAAALKAGQKPAEQWKRTEKAIEMDRTLSEYTAAGVTYTYHRCDVSNAADVSALLDQIRATDGPISGVIHGAGIESASRFDRKTRGIVEATVSIKVGGAVALMQATRQDPLTHFIGFGSTSGRFGGLGQTDYSLASDLLCKMCAWLGVERPEVRSVGIHWPPWDEVGMAARPESRLALSASGLTFMPPLEGAAHVLDEVALAPTEAEVVFVDQLGDLDSDGTMQAGQSSDVDAKSSGSDLPWRWLPEGFCELFRIEHPQTSAFDLSNVTIERGLRFHSARPQRVTWNAKGDADAMQCELVSDFRDRRGRLIDVNRTYSKGLVAAAVAGERLVTRDPGAQPTDGWVPAPYYSDWESMNGDDDRPYHAAPLNGLTSLRSVADGTWLKVTVRDDSDLRPSATPNNFATSPTALDACLLGVELTNFWKHGVTSLPVRFGQVRIHRRPEPGEECIARIWELGRDEQAKASRADIVLFDSQGRVVAELKDFVHADVSASPGTPDSMRRPEWRNASEPVSTPASPTATGSSTSGEMSLPLITDWQQTGPTTGQGRFDLDTAADPFLKEHRLNDRPILPAVIGLEALVEGAATSLDVESDTIVVENFEVLRPLRLDDATTRTLTVRVSDLGQGLECRLESEDGIWPDGPIYHGEPFRCLQEMFLWRDGGWGTLTAKAAGELLGSHRSGTPLTPSSLIDSALVVCGVDAFWMTGPRIEMPHQIGRLRVRRLPQAGEECVVRMFFREQDKAGTTYDFCIFGADGEWIAEVLGYRGMDLPAEGPVELAAAPVRGAASADRPHWLTPDEAERWSSLSDPRRRMTWAIGRGLIKVITARYLARNRTGEAMPVDPKEIQIDSVDGLQRRVAPRVTWRGRWLRCQLALTHSDHWVAVAISLDPECRVGIDLVPGLLETTGLDWAFSPQESNWLESSRERGKRRAWLWGMKEALFKSAGNHLAFRPQQIELLFNGVDCDSARVGQDHIPISWHTELSLGDERLIAVGRVALVTGGARGIGRATAIRLAQAGADIVVNYVTSKSAAESVGEEISQLGRNVAIIKADVSEREDVETMLEFVGDEFGRLDILVSNAASGGFRPLLATSDRHFANAMNTNVRALLYLVQAAVPLMDKTPGRKKIIGLSSHGSHMALPMYGVIGGTKAALESIVRHLALELGDRGFNANVVQAGLVETDSTKRLPGSDEMFAQRRWKQMVGERDLLPEDVANAALFLASPLSDLVQGQTLIVDGGAAVHV